MASIVEEVRSVRDELNAKEGVKSVSPQQTFVAAVALTLFRRFERLVNSNPRRVTENPPTAKRDINVH